MQRAYCAKISQYLGETSGIVTIAGDERRRDLLRLIQEQEEALIGEGSIMSNGRQDSASGAAALASRQDDQGSSTDSEEKTGPSRH